MNDIHSIWELLAGFVPCFASLTWIFFLFVSLRDGKASQGQKMKITAIIYFALFLSGCLLGLFQTHLLSVEWLFHSWMTIVFIGIPVLGYRLVSFLPRAGKNVSLRNTLYLVVPAVVVVLWNTIVSRDTTILIGCYIGVMICFVTVGSLFVFHIVCGDSSRPDFVQEDRNETLSESKPEIVEIVALRKATPQRMTKALKNTSRKPVTEPLTRERFEKYIGRQKPYLNPQLKITDLVEPLHANRTVISNFVNNTYGMNFNRYINHLRLGELERLQNSGKADGKSKAELIAKAGFASMRNYTRAINAAQDGNPDEES